jgi:hypothetical protein
MHTAIPAWDIWQNPSKFGPLYNDSWQAENDKLLAHSPEFDWSASQRGPNRGESKAHANQTKSMEASGILRC